MRDQAVYAREIERYLCRKNDGHLIRIVGPAFEQVCGWATQGVPLKVAFRGIDRCCERYYAKARRRPVRIEFCEADVLELFDDWRRAVGVTASSAAGVPTDEPKPRKAPLASHIERAVARLATARAKDALPPAFVETLDAIVRELETMTDESRNARGERRAQLIERLAEIDRRLMEAVRQAVDAPAAARLREEAAAELAPFGARLLPAARAQAADAAFERLLRESMNLPDVRYDP